MSQLSDSAKSVSIRRSLVLNISTLMLLLGASIVAIMFYGTREQVNTLSSYLVQRALQQTHSELERFLRPITRSLGVAYHWSVSGLLQPREPERMRNMLQPVLTEFPQMSSLLTANGHGDEYMILRTAQGWLARETRVDEWQDKSRVWHWQDEQEPQMEWQTLHYDPRQRPWFQGAVERLKKISEQIPKSQDIYERVHWTEPYTFFTTKEPGITASLAHFDHEGLAHVVGIDILLTDISRFTTQLKVSEHGMVFVLTEDGRMLGLPRDASLTKQADWQKWLLKTPDALGVPAITAGVQAYRNLENKKEPFAFEHNGHSWWGGTVEFHLSSYRKLLIGVVLPEEDVTGNIYLVRYSILTFLIIVIALSVIRILNMARRYSRPIEALVEDSYRISHGDLGEPEPIATRVTEVQELAKAHDAMREGLRNLLKMERDMQLAKQIQQKALPQELPFIHYFKIAAWNLPADETGGDSYDVLALNKKAEGSYYLANGDSDYALCMLADAAGHGIGPALSVTQVRSMLRMAVRQGLELPSALAMLNQQILEDLSGGRFITLWLAILDAHAKQILSYSAGQAPLLHYRASDKSFQVFEADSPPVGIVESLNLTSPQVIDMQSGDFFVVLSDGIYEAVNAKGESFGVERVKRIIGLNPEQTVQELLEHIRHSLDVFTDGAVASDDRTALIIKCI